MKIIFIIDKLKIGGKANRFLEVVHGLAISHEIIILVYNIDFFYNINKDIKIIYLKKRSKYNILSFKDIYNVIKTEKPQIVHSWSTFATIYCFPSKCFRKFKLIDNSVSSAERISVFSKKQLLSYISYYFSDIIIANSQAGIKAYRIPSSKSMVIRNGFDFRRILNIDEKQNNNTFLTDNDQIIIGMVARFDDNKDYYTYFEAAKKLQVINKNLKFYALGDGKNYNKLKNQYKDFDNIVFTGAVKNPKEYIQKFHICVLTTYTEGISNTLMEYMAFSKAIITTDCPGTRELISNNIEGILISKSNVQKLVNEIAFLINDWGLRQTLGKNAYQKLQAEFSYSKMINSYLNLYENI